MPHSTLGPPGPRKTPGGQSRGLAQGAPTALWEGGNLPQEALPGEGRRAGGSQQLTRKFRTEAHVSQVWIRPYHGRALSLLRGSAQPPHLLSGDPGVHSQELSHHQKSTCGTLSASAVI